MKTLYYMAVKYRHYKQICQTLRQNDIQLNKSVTNARTLTLGRGLHANHQLGKPIGIVISLLFLFTFALVRCAPTPTEQATNTGSLGKDVLSAQDVAISSVITLPQGIGMAEGAIHHPTALATPLPPTPDVTAGAARLVLIATSMPTEISRQSPLPTPITVLTSPLTTTLTASLTFPVSVAPPVDLPSTADVQAVTVLSDTVAIQNQMTISMAIMARSLLQILQQPVEIPGIITETTAVSPIITETTPVAPVVTESSVTEPPLTVILSDTVAPPLPTDQIGGIALPPDNMTEEPEQQPIPAVVPLPIQPDGEVRTAHVPILMYHYLSDPPANADIYRRDLSLSPTRFAEHLDRITRDGYTVIPLYDLVAYLLEGTPLPPKPVVITFDDGYRDNYENAFPLLRERNLPATFFVVMEFINQERPEYLTWEMVREMAAGGMTFEVHGVDHTTLRGRSQADLEFQALRSYETLQNLLNLRPRFVSYPAGEYDQQTIDIFQKAGYWAGLTTIQGATHRSDKLFELHRVRIRGTTTADELSNLLALEW